VNVADEGSSGLAGRFRRSPVTWIITAINVAVFIVAEQAGNTLETETLVRFGANERGRIWAGEYWRLLTAVFLHIGPVHLFWNAWAMFGWCAPVERTLGPWRFALVYLLTGIGASAVSMLAHDVVSAGASGAGFGMIGIALVFLYRRAGGNWDAFRADPDVRSTVTMTLLWIVLGFLAVSMDNYAHLGGLGFGLLAGLAFRRRSDAPLRWGFARWSVLVLAWAVAITLAARPGPGARSNWAGLEAKIAGDQALGRRDFAEAIRQYDRVEEMGFRDPEVYAQRGIARRERGDLDGAIRDFTAAIRLDPREPGAYVERAAAYERSGDRSAAAADYRSALALAGPSWSRRAKIEAQIRALGEEP
jgi:membrane associated rhomboid family serine protease